MVYRGCRGVDNFSLLRLYQTWDTDVMYFSSWWRHQMEIFSALLDICAGNSPVPGEFHTQRPVTRSLDVFFDLHLNKPLSKQSRGWWFEMPPCPLWRHSNADFFRYEPVGGVSPNDVQEISKIISYNKHSYMYRIKRLVQTATSFHPAPYVCKRRVITSS